MLAVRASSDSFVVFYIALAICILDLANCIFGTVQADIVVFEDDRISISIRGSSINLVGTV
jgi:hypothetical protein